jgi:uncharacterized protein YbjT (DUF2867 family)
MDILVIGATGQQGGAAARALLRRGHTVRALVRDPARALAGARSVVGDLDDPASVQEAMAGADGVFLVLSPLTGPRVTADGVAAEERRGATVVELAARAGIAHLVYSSVAGADQGTGISHLESKGHIEAHIRRLGVPATMLRPAFFMENFTTHTPPAVVDGELVVRLALSPDTSMQLVAVQDIGEFAAIAFDRALVGQTMVVAGDARSGPEIAERLGAARGMPARFEQSPLEQVRAFDPEVARMFEWFDSGKGEQADLPALRALHPGLSTFEGWLAATPAVR